MPVMFLSDLEAASYGRYGGSVPQADLERFFYLDDAGQALPPGSYATPSVASLHRALAEAADSDAQVAHRQALAIHIEAFARGSIVAWTPCFRQGTLAWPPSPLLCTRPWPVFVYEAHGQLTCGFG